MMGKRKTPSGEPSGGVAVAEDSGSDEVRGPFLKGFPTKRERPTPVGLFCADLIKDFDTLDVDFEWFDPQPEYDFHGIKTLLQQLFDIDAQLFELSALTDLILAQPLLGSTVKVGDEETKANATDAYAFLSVINLQEHQV